MQNHTLSIIIPAFNEENNVELVVLAGFMRILGPDIIREYKNRIINIHPALLPSFRGAHAIKDAFLCGVKVTGVTVHFVDEEMDHGPIILQEPVKIKEGDTAESTGKVLQVPVGKELVGRVVDPLGNPIDGRGELKTKERSLVEKIAPGVITRQSVREPSISRIRRMCFLRTSSFGRMSVMGCQSPV